jgi:hypothetical protein
MAITGQSESFICYFETETMPRSGDTISLFNDTDHVLEMDVSTVDWQLEGGRLLPTVHCHGTGGCSPDDFLAFGWIEG